MYLPPLYYVHCFVILKFAQVLLLEYQLGNEYQILSPYNAYYSNNLYDVRKLPGPVNRKQITLIVYIRWTDISSYRIMPNLLFSQN